VIKQRIILKITKHIVHKRILVKKSIAIKNEIAHHTLKILKPKTKKQIKKKMVKIVIQKHSKLIIAMKKIKIKKTKLIKRIKKTKKV